MTLNNDIAVLRLDRDTILDLGITPVEAIAWETRPYWYNDKCYVLGYGSMVYDSKFGLLINNKYRLICNDIGLVIVFKQ